MKLSTELSEAASSRQPVRGGRVRWACQCGFPPSTIFPFTPPERIGIRNLFEFQVLMYRPLYYLGRHGQAEIDHDRSLAEPPEWSEDGRSVTITLKPWQWSNGEPICADNVMFWMNVLSVKATRFGNYTPGCLPDNLTSYEKLAEDTVRFTFDGVYSKTWMLMNQFTLITPMPKAWDRFSHDTPANASSDITDAAAVYDYLAAQNGPWTEEDNQHRTRWPDSPVWSVVSGPWRMKTFALDGTVTFVPNERYSGPDRPSLDEFCLVPTHSDEEQFGVLQAGPDGPDALQVGYLPYGLAASASNGSGDAGDAGPLGGRYRLVPQNIYMISYMPLNFENPTVPGRIINQAYFRQALQAALDQDTIIREYLHGYGYRTTGPVPLVPDSNFVSPAQRDNPIPFDIKRARKLLEDHGWDLSTTPGVCLRGGAGPGRAGEGIEPGARLSFRLRCVAGRAAVVQIAEQLKADAAKAGIEIELEEVYGSVLVGQDHGESSAGNPHLWQMQFWNGGWSFQGYPTGEVVFKTGAGINFGRYSDPRADELMDRVIGRDDVQALYEYQDYLAEQVPVIWTPGSPLRLFAVANNLRGVEPVNPYGILNPEDWYYVDD
jgi:peptide/nickel transport system substrate-binding protein